MRSSAVGSASPGMSSRWSAPKKAWRAVSREEASALRRKSARSGVVGGCSTHMAILSWLPHLVRLLARRGLQARPTGGSTMVNEVGGKGGKRRGGSQGLVSLIRGCSRLSRSLQRRHGGESRGTMKSKEFGAMAYGDNKSDSSSAFRFFDFPATSEDHADARPTPPTRYRRQKDRGNHADWASSQPWTALSITGRTTLRPPSSRIWRQARRRWPKSGSSPSIRSHGSTTSSSDASMALTRASKSEDAASESRRRSWRTPMKSSRCFVFSSVLGSMVLYCPSLSSGARS